MIEIQRNSLEFPIPACYTGSGDCNDEATTYSGFVTMSNLRIVICDVSFCEGSDQQNG